LYLKTVDALQWNDETDEAWSLEPIQLGWCWFSMAREPIQPTKPPPEEPGEALRRWKSTYAASERGPPADRPDTAR